MKKTDRYYFSFFAFYFLFTQFIGFYNSTSVRIAAEGPLSATAIVHGLFGGLWYLIFALQCVLISNKKVKWHKTLGQISFPVIFAVFLTGMYAIFRLSVAEEEIPYPLMRSEVGLFTLTLIFAGLGYTYRKKPHAHKRYFLMSAIMLSPAGVVRFWDAIGFDPGEMIYFFILLFLLPFISILVYDLLVYRKVFKASLIGLGLYLINLWLGGFWGQFVTDYVRPVFL